MTTNENPRFTALMDHLRTGLCAEYEASDTLKIEFLSADGFAAFTLNQPAAKNLIREWQAGIDETENLAAFNAAAAAGRVRTLGRATG